MIRFIVKFGDMDYAEWLKKCGCTFVKLDKREDGSFDLYCTGAPDAVATFERDLGWSAAAWTFDSESQAGGALAALGYVFDSHLFDHAEAGAEATLQTTCWTKDGELLATLQWDAPADTAKWRVEFGTVDEPPEGSWPA